MSKYSLPNQLSFFFSTVALVTTPCCALESMSCPHVSTAEAKPGDNSLLQARTEVGSMRNSQSQEDRQAKHQAPEQYETDVDPCGEEDEDEDHPESVDEPLLLRPWKDVIVERGNAMFLNRTTGDLVQTQSFDMKKIDFHQHAQKGEEALQLLMSANRNAGVAKSVLLALRGIDDGKAEVEEANNRVMQVSKKYPHFIPFVTIHPSQSWSPHMFRKYVGKGARGLKLIDWHSRYINKYNYSLDNPVMMDIYKIAEEERVPILLHVWLGFQGYEYSRVLDEILSKFPRLRLVLAHMGLGFHPKEFPKLRALLKKHKHLYVDTSFYGKYKEVWFTRASEQREALAKLVREVPDQVLFGSDTFASSGAEENYYDNALRCQTLYVEFDELRCSEFQKTDFYRPSPDVYGSRKWAGGKLHGLGIKNDLEDSQELLKKIFHDNAAELLSLRTGSL